MRVSLLILFAAFLCSAIAQEPQASAPRQTGTSVVSGVILNEVTREPIRRVEVRLYRMPGGAGSGPATGGPTRPVPVVTATDVEGRFRFESVATGRYGISYQRQGFLGSRNGSPGYPSAGNDAIEVAEGVDVRSLRYTLLPQAVLAGRVIDNDGEPVHGAHVMTMTRQFVGGKRKWRITGGQATNDLGEFRLAHIHPEKTLLAVLPASVPGVADAARRDMHGERETADMVTFYPGVLTLEQATPVDVKAGAKITNLDITLRQQEVYRIRGVALTEDGQPLQGYYVTLFDALSEGQFPPGRFVPKSNGAFEIEAVPNGSYTMILRMHEGNRVAPHAAPQSVQVSGRDVDGVVIQLRPGVRVSGTVVLEGLDRNPQLGGNRVALAPVDQQIPHFGATPTPTKDDGSFTIVNVAPGRYLLHAYGPGLARVYRAGTVVGNTLSRGIEIEVSEAGISDMRVVFRSDGGSIKGKVEDIGSPDNRMRDVTAVMLPVDKEALESSGGGEMISMVSHGGSFQYLNVPPGDYRLWVFSGYDLGALLDPEVYQKVESHAAKVTVRPSEGTAVTVKVADLLLE